MQRLKIKPKPNNQQNKPNRIFTMYLSALPVELLLSLARLAMPRSPLLTHSSNQGFPNKKVLGFCVICQHPRAHSPAAAAPRFVCGRVCKRRSRNTGHRDPLRPAAPLPLKRPLRERGRRETALCDASPSTCGRGKALPTSHLRAAAGSAPCDGRAGAEPAGRWRRRGGRGAAGAGRRRGSAGRRSAWPAPRWRCWRCWAAPGWARGRRAARRRRRAPTGG